MLSLYVSYHMTVWCIQPLRIWVWGDEPFCHFESMCLVCSSIGTDRGTSCQCAPWFAGVDQQTPMTFLELCRLLSLLTSPLREKQFDATEGKPCWVNHLPCLKLSSVFCFYRPPSAPEETLGEGFPSRWSFTSDGSSLPHRTVSTRHVYVIYRPHFKTVCVDVAVHFF